MSYTQYTKRWRTANGGTLVEYLWFAGEHKDNSGRFESWGRCRVTKVLPGAMGDGSGNYHLLRRPFRRHGGPDEL